MLSERPSSAKTTATTSLHTGTGNKQGIPEASHIKVGMSSTNIKPPNEYPMISFGFFDMFNPKPQGVALG